MGGGFSSSESESDSRPVDMTPPEFRELRQPFADVVAQLLGFGPMQSQPARPTGGGRPGTPGGPARPAAGGAGTARGVTRGGNARVSTRSRNAPSYAPYGTNAAGGVDMDPYNSASPLSRPMNASTGTQGSAGGGSGGGGGGGAGGSTTSPYGPVGDPTDPLRGFPQYEGPLVAPLGRGEQRALSVLRGDIGSRDRLIDAASRTGFGNSYNQMPRWNMEDIQADEDMLGISELDYETGAYDTAGNPFAGMDFGTDNPFFQDAVTAAQRTTMQNLEETLDRALPSMFTRGGHMIQYDPESGVGGSSAFNRAAALASRGAVQEMGDIAGEMSFQAWDAERNRELAAIDAQQNRILQSITSDRGMEAEFQNQELQREFEALEAEKGRILSARQSERGMQFQGGEGQRERRMQGIQLGQQEVQSTIQNLQAQALPRLIQDLGIERGMEQFNNRMNALMILLQTAGGVGSPTVSNVSESDSSSLGMQKPSL